MLFYATLLITSFLLTLVILGIKNLIVFFTRKAFRRSREDVRFKATAHLKNRAMGAGINTVSEAWGKQAHAAPATMAKMHPAMPASGAPWGWPGSDSETREQRIRPATTKGSTLDAYLARKYEKQQSVGDWKRNVGRPTRDDRSALSGQAYKPSQDAISKYGMDKDDDKPWGW